MANPLKDRLVRSGGVLLLAMATFAVLCAMASGYGYHRDELYFLAAGRHLAWAYPDQGPITPLIARAMNDVAPGSLTVLRLPSALAAALTVLLTGMLAAELGAARRAQLLAAGCTAVSVMVLFTGHTLSTTTFDLLDWTAVSWLTVRAIRTGRSRLWLTVGTVLGIGLLNKPLPAFLAAGLVAGMLIGGPRRLLLNRYVWGGAAIACALWSPWIIWQMTHDWPQITISQSISSGGSTSSQPWWQLIPFQALLAGPLLAPVWIAGLVRLFRNRNVRALRFLAWTWLVLAVFFTASGGKPYYLAGLLPLLTAAGSAPVDGWLSRRRTRGVLLVAVVGVSTAAGTVIALPVLPAVDAGIVVAMNPDVGETIGWPQLARTVAGVARNMPSTKGLVIFTRNYGEAGAIDRFGPALGLSHAYSGHNAYGSWGPPSDRSGPVITIGISPAIAATEFRNCVTSAHIDNHAHIDNEERDAPVLTCSGPRQPWTKEWPRLRHLN